MQCERGGFSKQLWDTRARKDYATTPPVGGYFGSIERTKVRDQIVEHALLKTGLEYEGAATWLTSVAARHLMDNVDATTSTVAFEGLVGCVTEYAFKDVTVWAHPDHDGTLVSTQKLRKKIFG